MSAHSCHRASLRGSISGRQIPVRTLSRDSPSIPRANHHAAPPRRFRAIAATARAALNAAATKAKIDSEVTADGSQNRAIKSFPASRFKVRNFNPKCIVGREVMRDRERYTFQALSSQAQAPAASQSCDYGHEGRRDLPQACMIIEPALRNHRPFSRCVLRLRGNHGPTAANARAPTKDKKGAEYRTLRL